MRTLIIFLLLVGAVSAQDSMPMEQAVKLVPLADKVRRVHRVTTEVVLHVNLPVTDKGMLFYAALAELAPYGGMLLSYTVQPKIWWLIHEDFVFWCNSFQKNDPNVQYNHGYDWGGKLKIGSQAWGLCAYNRVVDDTFSYTFAVHGAEIVEGFINGMFIDTYPTNILKLAQRFYAKEHHDEVAVRMETFKGK